MATRSVRKRKTARKAQKAKKKPAKPKLTRAQVEAVLALIHAEAERTRKGKPKSSLFPAGTVISHGGGGVRIRAAAPGIFPRGTKIGIGRGGVRAMKAMKKSKRKRKSKRKSKR